jgi:hypothetical protein
MELGVHAGEWSALPCGSAAPPPRGANGTIPLQREVITHTHTPGTQVELFYSVNRFCAHTHIHKGL